MSNFPTPKKTPPTTQQVDSILGSVITATQSLIGMDKDNITNLRVTFMKFYSHPTFQLVLGIPSQQTSAAPPPDNQLKTELLEIKSTCNWKRSGILLHPNDPIITYPATNSTPAPHIYLFLPLISIPDASPTTLISSHRNSIAQMAQQRAGVMNTLLAIFLSHIGLYLARAQDALLYDV